MNETNATQTTPATAPEAEASANGKERAAHKGMFATLEEAQAVKPEGDKLRLFQVLKEGKPLGFTWGTGVYDALVNAAKANGYTAGVAGKRGEITKEAVASKLAEFTDEQLAELGLTRKKEKKGK